MTHNKKLGNYLRQQIRVERQAGPVVRVELRHLPVGGKLGQEVMSIDDIPSSPDETWFDDHATLLISSAESDASSLGGMQQYAALTFRENKPDKATSRSSFRMQGDSEESDGFDSEPPSKTGIIAQLMRHGEVTQKLMMAHASANIISMQRTIDRLSDQNESLQSQRTKNIETYEALLSMQHERQLASQQAENKQRLMEEGLDTVKLLAPAVLNRLTGSKTFEGADPSKLALKSFADSLKPEQLASIGSALSPSQQAALMELFNSIQPTPTGTGD